VTDLPASVFPNAFVQRAWIAANCGTCFQAAEARRRLQGKGPGCPILAEALGSGGVLPRQWKVNPQTRGLSSLAEAMPGRYIKCDAYSKRPPVYRRPRAKAEGPQGELFAEPRHQDPNLVPVDGWPDYRRALRPELKSGCGCAPRSDLQNDL
jgi:hypothetical protein